MKWDGHILNELKKILMDDQITVNEPMKFHTTFKTGGMADYFVTPKNAEEMADVVKLCHWKQIDYFVLGNGSNVLFKDGGYRGVIISTKNLNEIELVSEKEIKVGAGVMLRDLSGFAMRNGLSGVEFVCGIPGMVGGAVCMNAGAYGSEISHVFVEGSFLSEDGNFCVKTSDEMSFGYRKSAVQNDGLIVLTATFRLSKSAQDEIKVKIDDLTEQRESKQPLADACAGSTFKRPLGHYAGKLIMDSGLAGFSIGGASVSKKHCGFVVNKGGATSSDVLAVITHVQNAVFEKFGVMLETEVKIVGCD